MQPDEQYIHELITEKLAGVIRHEEDLYLEKLIAENSQVKAMWEEIAAIQAEEEMRNSSGARQWASLTELLHGRRARAMTLKAILLAASITGLVLLAYLFISKDQPSPSLAVKPDRAIELKLANGSVITLSQNQDSIITGSALLSNSNKTLTYSQPVDGQTSSSLNSLTVPPGMDYRVLFSDGSEIWLNSSTTLQFPFTFANNVREITVKGEAYVKVAKNAQKPFIVHLLVSNTSSTSPDGEEPAGATVRVIGTEFNINTYDSSTLKVALVEGAVRFEAVGKTVAVKPGMEAVYSQNMGISTQPFDEEEVLGWRQGRYYLDEITLQEIAKGLPRWVGVEATIDNAAIQLRRYTGVLNRNKPIEVFLQSLKKTMKIDYYFSPDGVLHFK
jgi:transmembrane sensor